MKGFRVKGSRSEALRLQGMGFWGSVVGFGLGFFEFKVWRVMTLTSLDGHWDLHGLGRCVV